MFAKRIHKRGMETWWTNLVSYIDRTGSSSCQTGIGRLRTTRSKENIGKIQELILREEDRPQTHLTQREIARELGIFSLQ